MIVHTLPLGPLASNMFVIEDGEAFYIVDPSVSPDECASVIEGFDPGKVRAVLVTHAHFDHIFYIEEWQAKCSCDFFMSDDDRDLLSDPMYNVSAMIGYDRAFKADTKDISSLVALGNLKTEVIRTPGHTRGSVCFLVSDGSEKVIFTGDTVFAGGVGRTDFPTGNLTELMESVGKIKALDRSIVMYTGHGPVTTVGSEVDSNPYFY